MKKKRISYTGGLQFMDDRIFRDLQRHLDRQPVGFPADRSGSDIRLLKHHFTPEEARVALAMTYRYETADVIYSRYMKRFPGEENMLKPGDFISLLDSMGSRLSIMHREENGILQYCLVPLVIGMYEGKVFEMDSVYLEAYDSYAHAMQHGLSFISTDVPQMRTIPIHKAIPVSHEVLKYDDINEHINNSEGPIYIIECTCRKRKAVHGEPCKQTKRSETCMLFGDLAKMMQKFGHGREVSRDEAREIMRASQDDGLVLQTYNMQQPEVICACCGCCCEILGIQKMLPNPRFFTSANYFAVIDADKCRGCRLCEKKCSVGALKFDKKNKKVLVNIKRCIGCGNCVPVCRHSAVILEKKEKTAIPPLDFVNLQETIMRGKPLWRLGRVIKRSVFR